MLTFLSRALERKVEGDASVYTQVVKEAEAAEMNEERMYILVEALARCTAANGVYGTVQVLCRTGGFSYIVKVFSPPCASERTDVYTEGASNG